MIITRLIKHDLSVHAQSDFGLLFFRFLSQYKDIYTEEYFIIHYKLLFKYVIHNVDPGRVPLNNVNVKMYFMEYDKTKCIAVN